MIGVGRGWKEKMREERNDSKDFIHDPELTAAECR